MIHAGLFKQKGNLYASFGMNQLPTAAMGYAITDNLGLAANLHGESLGGTNHENYNYSGVVIGTADYEKSQSVSRFSHSIF